MESEHMFMFIVTESVYLFILVAFSLIFLLLRQEHMSLGSLLKFPPRVCSFPPELKPLYEMYLGLLLVGITL
jgi:hypothetical protein